MVPLNTGTLCGLWVTRKLHKAFPLLPTAFSLGFHGDRTRCELCVRMGEYTLHFLLAQGFGEPQEFVGEDKGPEAALVSMKNVRAGEILKAPMTLRKLPSNTSYRVSTDTSLDSGNLCLRLRTYKPKCALFLVDVCPFVATTTTTTKF